MSGVIKKKGCKSPYCKYGKKPYPYTESSLATASAAAKEENWKLGWRPGRANGPLDDFIPWNGVRDE